MIKGYYMSRGDTKWKAVTAVKEMGDGKVLTFEDGNKILVWWNSLKASRTEAVDSVREELLRLFKEAVDVNRKSGALILSLREELDAVMPVLWAAQELDNKENEVKIK